MGKYERLNKTILAIFGTAEWNAEGIKAFPSNFIGVNPGEVYIRVNVIPSGPGLNKASVSGQILIDIFTPAGKGPLDAALVADRLDAHLVGKSKMIENCLVQFLESSSMSLKGLDKGNPSLSKALYAISFNYFGV